MEKKIIQFGLSLVFAAVLSGTAVRAQSNVTISIESAKLPAAGIRGSQLTLKISFEQTPEDLELNLGDVTLKNGTTVIRTSKTFPTSFNRPMRVRIDNYGPGDTGSTWFCKNIRVTSDRPQTFYFNTAIAPGEYADGMVTPSRTVIRGDVAFEGSYDDVIATPLRRAVPAAAAVSKPSAGGVNLRFMNGTKDQIRYFWLDGNTEKLYGTINADAIVDQQTYPAHQWRFRMTDGRLLGEYAASAEPTQNLGFGNPVFEVGPIFNQQEAAQKCGALESKVPALWTGTWWTTIENKMAVCKFIQLYKP